MAAYRIFLIDATILFALVCGAYWKLTLTNDYTWANDSDMSDQVLPWLQFQAREWHAGRPWPLWDPHHWGGQSLIGQIQPAVMYPLNWLLFLAAKGSITLPLLGWYLVLARYLGAVFFYWLVRDCGRSRTSAIFGGVLFACTGYVGTTEWPQVVNGAVWAPLIMMFGLRLLRGRTSSAPWLGAALGMSVLAGHYQIPSHLAILAGALIVLSGWRQKSWRWALSAALAVGLFAFLIGAAQILPAQEYWRGAMRWVGGATEPLTWQDRVPFASHAADSLDPVSVVGVVIPRIYTSLSNPYAGFAGLVLAVFAVVSGWRSFRIRVIAALLALFLLISLGAATWMYGAAYVLVPGFEKSRHPATAVAVWHMCLVLLACFGFDRLRHVRREFMTRTAALLALFSLFIYGTMVYLSLANPARVFGRNEQTMAALTALALSGALFGFLRGALPLNRLRLVCLSIALVEVSNVAGYSYMHRSSGWEQLRPLFEDGDIADFLRYDPSFVRVNFDRSEISYNFGDWWGLDQYQGYTGVPEHLFRRAFEPEVRKLFGETHWLSKSANWEGKTPVFLSRRGIAIYRVDSTQARLSCGKVVKSYPGYWLLDGSGCQGSSAARRGRRGPPSDQEPSRWPPIPASPPEANRGRHGDPPITQEHSTPIPLFESSSERGSSAIVLKEAWAPGWTATLDGKSIPVDRHEGLLMSVPLGPAATPVTPSGSRLWIELRYEPGSAKWGILLTIVGILALIGLSGIRRIRAQAIRANLGS